MKKTTTLFILSVFAAMPLIAQPPQAWNKRFNGIPDQSDEARSIAVDAAGNSYVTGASFNNNNFNLDIVTIKYSPSGTPLWQQTYDGGVNDNDEGREIVVDNAGNSYVTGYSRGANAQDIIVIKYDPNGTELWHQSYNGQASALDDGYAIAIDPSGNVYAGGITTTNGFDFDAVVIKYNSAGTQQWATVYESGVNGGNDDITDIAVDASGNVYSIGTCDSSGSTINVQMMTTKFSSSGAVTWRKIYNGPSNDNDYGKAITLDNSGNVIVCGYSFETNNWFDYVTVKYNSSGTQQWAMRYNYGANRYDEPWDVIADTLGNVYVTGQSQALGNNGTPPDFATIKYNSAGAQQWVSRYNGSANDDDRAVSIGLDDSLNVYVSGYSKGTSSVLQNFAIVRYSPAGTQQWVITYNGQANKDDRSNSMVVWGNGDVWVTGVSQNLSNDDYLTARYSYSSIGFKEYSNDVQLNVYPNPASDVVNITLHAENESIRNAQLVIYDITGREIVRNAAQWISDVNSNSTTQVNTGSLTSGTYFLAVLDNEGRVFARKQLIIK